MKQFLLIILSSAIVAISHAQIPVALDRLDGRWSSGNIFAEWVFTDDYALNNVTRQVIAGDTTELYRVYIRADHSGNTTLTYITPYGENHQFKLVVADVYGSTWKNIQEDAVPTCLKIERQGLQKYIWNGIGETMTFKHEKEGRVKLNLGILLGANASMTPTTPFKSTYRTGNPGTEAAVSVHIGRTHSAVGVNMEVGFMQLRNSINYTGTEQGQLPFYVHGRETKNYIYAGLFPEGRFGKKEQFSFSPGIWMTYAQKSQFDGVLQSGTYNDEEIKKMVGLQAPKGGKLGLSVGFAYRPGFRLGHIQPAIYVRYIYRSACSAGVKFEF